MAKYEVELELSIYAPVKIIVEADDKKDAIDTAIDAVPLSFLDATKSQNWKATVTFEPPQYVRVPHPEVKASMIVATRGGERVREIKPRKKKPKAEKVVTEEMKTEEKVNEQKATGT